MKILKKLSLKMRITLLTGGILMICSIFLALGASYNAHNQFEDISIAQPAQIQVAGKITEEQIEALTNGDTKNSTITPALTKAKKQFDTTNFAMLAIVSFLGMGMVYFVVGKSLRPIHNLSKTISIINEDNLQERISIDNGNDEVNVLGQSFNTMLDRLEKSFLRQKQFSANVAHELKTPLATMNAGIQVLQLDNDPTVSELKNTIATTQRNTNRLMEIVDNLMHLYEQEEIITVSVDLKNLFEAILSELRPALDEKHIETELHCELKTVKASQVLLYRACFNLIENAIKYNKGSGFIAIETKIEDGTGRIIISDSGNGIPADELQQIFEPFYRVSKSRSRKTGGAGLGLSIVKAVVEKHGWKIHVDSELGQGSRFTITCMHE